MLKRNVIDPRIKTKTADLFKQPVVIRVTRFNDEAVEKFTNDMAEAHDTGQPIIPVIVDSYGGSVYALMSMISEIKNAKIPVATICEGKAMSAGAVFFSFGKEGCRYMAPNATLMIHEVFSVHVGKVEELKVGADETDRLNTLALQMMAENCGKDPDYFIDIIHDKGHADWYLTAREAKKHNIVNHVKIPEFRVEVSINMTFK